MVLLGVAGRGGEVQLVFGPEDHVPRPDFQDCRRLQGGGDSEQGELRGAALLAIAIAALLVTLTGDKLEAALDVKCLQEERKTQRWFFTHEDTLDVQLQLIWSSNRARRGFSILALHPNTLTCCSSFKVGGLMTSRLEPPSHPPGRREEDEDLNLYLPQLCKADL